MSNAARILRALDSRLDHAVELTLFGRAALALGYPAPPRIVERSLDVDAIIPAHQLRDLEGDEQFWSALEETNEALDSEGLYLTHLFREEQIALSPGWLDRRVPILLKSMAHLNLFRPSTVDLILTKMMRGADEEDMGDIRFLMSQDDFQSTEFALAVNAAVLPGIPEIRALFSEAKRKVLDEFR